MSIEVWLYKLNSEGQDNFDMNPGFLSEVKNTEMRIGYKWENGELFEIRTYETKVGKLYQLTRKDPDSAQSDKNLRNVNCESWANKGLPITRRSEVREQYNLWKKQLLVIQSLLLHIDWIKAVA